MNKINISKILSYIPELIILVVSIFWFVENLLVSGFINYLSLAIIFIVSALLIWKSKVLAIIVTVTLGSGCILMLLAVISEFREFPSGDPTGAKLMVTGSVIFITLAAITICMPVKYLLNNQ